MTRMLQIGVTALRTPDGEFLKPIPMYVKADDLATVSGTADGFDELVRRLRNGIASGKNINTEKERATK